MRSISLRLFTLVAVAVLLSLAVLSEQNSHAHAGLARDAVISPVVRTIDSLRTLTLRLDNRIAQLVAVDSSVSRRLLLPVISTELRADLQVTGFEQPVVLLPQRPESDQLEARIDQQNRYIGLIQRSIDGRRMLAEHLPVLTPTIGKYSSGFGYRVHPISGRVKMHEGVALSAPTGTPIRAAGDGVVAFAGRRNGYGNTLQLQHSYGYETLYGHCSRLLVNEGDTVKRGEIVALVGSTGRSTGPHLHYEVSVDGTKVAPDGFLIDEPIRPTESASANADETAPGKTVHASKRKGKSHTAHKRRGSRR